MEGQEFYTANQKLPTLKKSNVFGILNGNGQKITDFKYENIHFSQHHFLVSVEKNGPCDVLDTTGRVLFSNISNAYFLGNEKFVWIKKLDNLKNGKWSLYKKDGTLVSKTAYDNVFFTSYPDHALVLKDSAYSFVDTTGKTIFMNFDYLAIKESIAGYYASNKITAGSAPRATATVNPSIIIFKDKESKRFGVKINGKSVVAAVFSEIRKTDRNVFIVKKANKCGLIDFSGKTVLNLDYDKITEITEKIIIVANNGKYGVIDRTNKKVRIPLTYNELTLIK